MKIANKERVIKMNREGVKQNAEILRLRFWI